MKSDQENKAHGKASENKGKAAAPGQQTADSKQPAPGKSGEPGRGNSPENRAARDAERAAERAADDSAERAKEMAENGGGVVQDPQGNPVPDGTYDNQPKTDPGSANAVDPNAAAGGTNSTGTPGV